MIKTTNQDVAMKVIRGELLSKDEFRVALQAGYYNIPVNECDKAYESLKASHYNSPTRQGYLCSSHKTGRISETEICGWGLHLDELDPAYLTDANRAYLKNVK